MVRFFKEHIFGMFLFAVGSSLVASFIYAKIDSIAAAFGSNSLPVGNAAPADQTKDGTPITYGDYNLAVAKRETRTIEDFPSDCHAISSSHLRFVQRGPQWQISDGHRDLLAEGASDDDARAAMEVIRRHGFNERCPIGKGDEVEQFWLASGDASTDRLRIDSDCLAVDQNTLTVKRQFGLWTLSDLSFGQPDSKIGFASKEDALRALAMVRKFRFNLSCYVGRPNPAMTYWLRAE